VALPETTRPAVPPSKSVVDKAPVLITPVNVGMAVPILAILPALVKVNPFEIVVSLVKL